MEYISSDRYEYLVEWAGYPTTMASWEPASHIPLGMREAFDRALPHGRAAQVPELTAPECRELTTDERTAVISTSHCKGSFKEAQSNPPGRGYLSRTWGLVVFNRCCVIAVDWDEAYRFESISLVTWLFFRLIAQCPALLDR